MMNRKVLLVVPHQDDELFVGGGLLKQLVDSGRYEAYVVFTTNGDFFPQEGEVRLRESLYVLTRLFAVPEAHIFFLGYGDGWQGGRHLYNLPAEQPAISHCGRRETYGIDGHAEYRQLKSGGHSAYCRDHFKADMKELLSDLAADILIAVDYDKHPDHKAASLMLEECMGELLKERPDYRPVVLKRYAYDGVWKGKADFFDLPRKRTILSRTDQSPYAEEDKICTGMPVSFVTPYLHRNFLYAAGKCYRTQEVWQVIDQIVNLDEVYWRRNTNNLLYDASLRASSGNMEYLRDFKLYDCADVLAEKFVPGECAWLPAAQDRKRELHIHFSCPQTIAQINLYALGDPDKDRLSGEFVLDNGVCLAIEDICLTGRKHKLTLEPQRNILDIDFRITAQTGEPMGITEMEILPLRDGEVPEELQQYVFREDPFPLRAVDRLGIPLVRSLFLLRRKLYRWFPNAFFLMRHYPQAGGGKRRLFYWRIRYICERINSRTRRTHELV